MGTTGLKDKVAIVTGANHGMGTATAIAFAKEGAKVLINYYRFAAEAYGDISEEEVEKATIPGRAYYCKMQTQTADHVVKAIEDLGGKCLAIEADLSEPANIVMLFDEAERALGPVDIVVNNAAYGKCDTFVPSAALGENPVFVDELPMTTITADTHDAHFTVNSRAVALMMAEFAKRFIARKANYGRIINISTDGAYCHPCAVSYGASKLGMESYTRAAATELGPYGITVNVISPGAVQTGWIVGRIVKEIERSYPLRRIGRPEDIANAVIFLASQQADWITGQVIQVGGGNRM
ncbi:MAG: SDR family NAD(P)-dependent oxidoreductase [Planctomycetota bacterium]|jgi:3-oxoacyl-[acyl-carrier protein] reductase